MGGEFLTPIHRFPLGFCPLSPFHHVSYCASLISFALIFCGQSSNPRPCGYIWCYAADFSQTKRDVFLSPGLWWAEFRLVAITNPVMLFIWIRTWVFVLVVTVLRRNTIRVGPMPDVYFFFGMWHRVHMRTRQLCKQHCWHTCLHSWCTSARLKRILLSGASEPNHPRHQVCNDDGKWYALI